MWCTMLIRLAQIQSEVYANKGTVYSLSEIYINPKYVICLREDATLKEKLLRENLFPEGLDKRQDITRINVQRGNTGLDVAVVGSPELIASKLAKGAASSG